MSKITNDGLTRSGTGCLTAVPVYPYGNSGRQRVNTAPAHKAD